MNINTLRFKAAFRAMSIHFGLSLLVAAVSALLVFTAWFPYPYRELAGGTELFMLVITVDLVCGPLLTFVLYSPTKPRREMLTDISLTVIVQLLALCYGVWTLSQVRPLYLVQAADKFNIVSAVAVDAKETKELSKPLRPKLFAGPIKVSLRDLTVSEQAKLNAQIKSGGKDAAEQPVFYENFQGNKAYQNGHELLELLIVYPEHREIVTTLMAKSMSDDKNRMRYLYIVGRQFWVVIVNQSGEILEYLQVK